MSFFITTACWQTQQPMLKFIRETVFINEQNIPITEEWDQFDALSTHILAWDRQNQPIGIGRLLPNGYLGRIAVLKTWRGKGIGKALVFYLINLGKHQFSTLHLHAQFSTVNFYRKLGFIPIGESFLEVGIPHQLMRLEMADFLAQ